VRFMAIHSGPLVTWQAQAIRSLLDLPDTTFVGSRKIPATREMRVPAALIGASARRAYVDEAQTPAIPRANDPDGDPDLCLAFDGAAAAEAPRTELGTWLFDADGCEPAPGLNAFCDDSDFVEARLLQIDAGGAVRLLRSGVFGVDRFSPEETVGGVAGELSQWPASVLSAIRNGFTDFQAAQPPRPARISRGAAVTRAVLRLGWRRAIARAEKPFYTYAWNIGTVRKTPAQIARENALPPVSWCEAGNGRFLADPFCATIDGVQTVFCEELDASVNRGIIVRCEIKENAIVPLERVLVEPYHLSYPFVFESEGSWYGIPEANQSGEVALYRLDNSGREWRRQCALIPGVRGVDSTVFSHGGKFWLMCGVSDDGPNHKLFVYHADALEGPWRPHVRNPVKIDIRSSRPAGAPFMLDGNLHRPAQDCTRNYGRRLSIQRITALDERSFEEHTIAVIDPPRGKYSLGLHTMSAIGDSTLVDGMYRTFSLRAALFRARRSFRKRFR